MTPLVCLLALYPVKAPVPSYLPYYLERLLGSLTLPRPGDFGWLPQALADCNAMQPHLDDLGAKLASWRHQLLDALEQKISDNSVPLDTPGLGTVPARDWIGKAGPGADKLLVRLDLVSANYNAFRLLAPTLPPQWETFCERLGVPTAVRRSKSFRQSVLGRRDPKWQQRQQAVTIGQIADALSNEIRGFRDRVLRRSPDEIVFIAESPQDAAASQLVAATARAPAEVELFTLRPIAFMPGRGLTWATLDDADLPAAAERFLGGHEVPVRLKPFAVPGNRFYLWLTRMVYGELVKDERDASYLDDESMARWAFDYNAPC